MQIIDFIDQWRNHPAGYGRRSDLDISDARWEEIYNLSLEKSDPLNERYVEPGSLLYRVHQKQNYFRDGDSQTTKIDFDNHWVSFTKDAGVILDTYFASKRMNGDVIVIKSDKAFDISEIFRVYEEYEVVAPLDKKDVVEVLSYEDFKDKYGKALD